MIDPITAISAATAAFNGVKQLVAAGREIEDVVGQLGKWYGAAADLNRAESQRKNPPIFTKLFMSGSVEEEALAIITHKKKLEEQEKQLQDMLNIRFGFGTWKEMVELRRKIRKEREETLYKQQERRKAFFEVLSVLFILFAGVAIVGGILFSVGLGAGWW
jgi:phage-related minor tail protein